MLVYRRDWVDLVKGIENSGTRPRENFSQWIHKFRL